MDAFARESGALALLIKSPEGTLRFPARSAQSAPMDQKVIRALFSDFGKIDQLIAAHDTVITRNRPDTPDRDPWLDALRVLADESEQEWADVALTYIHQCPLDQLPAAQLSNTLRVFDSMPSSSLSQILNHSLDLSEVTTAQERQTWLQQNGDLQISVPPQTDAYLDRKVVADWLTQALAEFSQNPSLNATLSDSIVTNDYSEISAAVSLPPPLQQWSVKLELADTEKIGEATRKRARLYQSIVLVVLLLSIGSSILIFRYLERQRRLTALKNNFVATVSHELKTPLAASRILLDTLLENQLSDTQHQEYIELISRENERLALLVDRFLTFSRLQQGQLRMEHQLVSIEVLLQPVTDWLTAHPQLTEGEFSMQIDASIKTVSADAISLQTCLINLIDNAIKFSEKPRQICLKVFEKSESVCFVVEDNGCGIPDSEQKRIFNRFYQIDQTLNRSHEGVGLGLNIAQMIIAAHKGQLSVSSLPSGGARFVIKLPIQKQTV